MLTAIQYDLETFRFTSSFPHQTNPLDDVKVKKNEKGKV